MTVELQSFTVVKWILEVSAPANFLLPIPLNIKPLIPLNSHKSTLTLQKSLHAQSHKPWITSAKIIKKNIAVLIW